MARGARASPAPAAPLPKVSFQKVEDDLSTRPGGVHDLQARSYGYNDFSEFRRPDYYIRHIEPLESDLARQVEYDMDEQDQEWLDALNTERKKEQLDKVSYEVFEIVMDRLEKEWFDLTKNIPKPDLAMPSEDSTCAICDDSEGENSNAIVFCDGCNLAVHQDCYGVPYIPEGQWLCRKCTVSPENPVSCILCPNEGGAFKQTVLGEWVHLLCAIWVPETRVANEVFMEPITGVDKISKQRWKLKCSVCDIREGACIQCAKATCFLAFHATCARKEKLLLPMKSTQGSEPVTLTCYCERHLPKEQQDARAIALAAEEEQEENNPVVNTKLSKSARAYAKTYKPGPPLVPALIVNRIMHYIGKVVMRKKPEFMLLMCRYWSLKREARRGAPLLKRLHLEPWTANASGKVQTDEEKAMKLEQLQRLRKDLENVRTLTELTRKRESRKLRQAVIIHNILSRCLFPHELILRGAFERIMGFDRQDHFKNPVNKNDVPDYFDIVKKPMCWTTIEGKLDRHEYWDIETFRDDIDLVINNATLYNKPGTSFFKSALRIRANAQPILGDLCQLSTTHPVPAIFTNGDHSTDMNVDGPIEKPLPPIGDLEPPLDVVELLVSADAIKDDIDLILDHDPIISLFNYELGKTKPPPPPPPPPPPKAPKLKRDRKAEYERKKQNKESAAAAAAALEQEMQLDASPGFRAPRTRRVTAAAAAFVAEAQGSLAEQPADTDATATEPPTSAGAPRTGPASRKRAAVALPGQSEVPPMVDDVDNQRSFTMFNHGWILPPDQRRGGRAPVDRGTVPPPKKRARTDRGTSRLSVFSTTASENQTLQTSVPTGQEGSSVPPEKTEGSVDVDVHENQFVPPPNIVITEALPRELPKIPPAIIQPANFIPPGNLVHTPNGTIIIEELDTPEIRRFKNNRRKAEKKRLAAEASAANVVPAPVSVPSQTAGAGPSTLPSNGNHENFEMESDLSSLSDGGNEELEGRRADRALVPPPPLPPPVPVPIAVPSSLKIGADPPAVMLKEGQRLEGGTLVWAKAETYPWWPAVIYEDDDPMVPPNVVKQCKQARQKRGIVLYILQFFDKSSSWQFLPLERFKLLGEDMAFDEELLSPRKQKWKSAALRQECRVAYTRAMAEMERESDIAEGEIEARAFNEAAAEGGGEGSAPIPAPVEQNVTGIPLAEQTLL